MAPEIRSVVETMAARLEALGHVVVEKTMPCDFEALREALDRISAATAAIGIGRTLERRKLPSAAGLVEPIALAWAEAGKRLSAIDYWEAVQHIHRVGRQVGAFFETFDAYLTPTVAQTPFPAEHRTPSTIEGMIEEIFSYTPFTGVYNASGCPAMTVPAGFFESGIPIGVQFGAAQGQEPMLYALAAQIEQAHPGPGLPLSMHDGV